jgi:2'-5' RNA ligase
MIKSYLEFIKESVDHKHEFGCVMLNLKIANWNNILSVIDKNDLYDDPNDDSYGLESNPHITVLYGLHSDISDDKVVSIINEYKYKDFKFNISSLDSFENEKYDVLKFTIEPDDNLIEFHNSLKSLPHTNDYPDYKPHITICYLSPGEANKYKGMIDIPEFKIESIIYSKTNGQELIYDTY